MATMVATITTTSLLWLGVNAGEMVRYMPATGWQICMLTNTRIDPVFLQPNTDTMLVEWSITPTNDCSALSLSLQP